MGPTGGPLRRIAPILALALVVLAVVLVLRALRLQSHQVPVSAAPYVALDDRELASRLAGGLRIPTVSNQDGAGRDDAAFLELHRYLEAQFPRVHAAMTRELVGGLSLLFTWAGSDPTLAPLVLMAHQDVVPVEPGTETSWEHPPFSGEIAGGYVWGRGALDDKCNLFGELEAAESLLREGVQPRRTILFAFGHDEELGGSEGATKIAALLAERKVRPLMVVDEGGTILQGLVPGVSAPVAAVGIAEKGYVSVELTVDAPGGHSSTPAPASAIGILAAAVRALERTPLPARLDGASRKLLVDGIGPEARLPYRIVLANLWLFGPVVERVLARVPAASATIRTTTALTVFEAGLKDNVIPSRARAVVNFRLLPGDDVATVLAHVERTVADPRVQIRALPKQREASSVSRADGEGWELLARSIREVHPDTIVAPFLVLGGTDSRHFQDLTNAVYRFMPMRLELEDTHRIHGINERASVEGYADLVRSYRRLLENAAQ